MELDEDYRKRFVRLMRQPKKRKSRTQVKKMAKPAVSLEVAEEKLSPVPPPASVSLPVLMLTADLRVPVLLLDEQYRVQPEVVS